MSFVDVLKQIHIKKCPSTFYVRANTLPSDIFVGLDVNVQMVSRI
jgi:argonaute-like protein implicated in RNA metabolism and viral defense